MSQTPSAPARRRLIAGLAPAVCFLSSAAAAANVGGFCGSTIHDCFTIGGPGCSDAACCEIVCAADPFCCRIAWDDICVSEAQVLCVGCPEPPCEGAELENEPFGQQLNGGCSDASVASNCCVSHPSAGCDEAVCENDVCTVDPSCCAQAWDSSCVSWAEVLCPKTCASVFGRSDDIKCGTPRCGTIWHENGSGGEDDVDSYAFTVDQDFTAITVAAVGDFAIILTLRDSTTCMSPSDEIMVETDGCSTTLSVCIGAGEYVIAVRGSEGSLVMSEHHYRIELTCADPGCTPIGCGNPANGSCYDQHANSHCDDAECCQLVCAFDFGCCQYVWDAFCADLAWCFCAPGGAPVNDECANAIPVSEGAYPVSTCGAQTDGKPTPQCPAHGSGNVYRDVWFLYTPRASGIATIATCGSDFAEQVAVYDGCACDSTADPIACAYRPCPREDLLCVPVDSAHCYRIRIGGLEDDQSGDAVLTITLDASCDAAPACPNPAHDCFTPGAVGCADEACCEVVCALYSSCCDHAWDCYCVDVARLLCEGTPCRPLAPPPGALVEPEPCGANLNGGCSAVLPCSGASGNCCSQHPSEGCIDPACAAAVCAIAPDCCDYSWFSDCAQLACLLDLDCDCDSGSSGPFVTPIECGDTIFGTAWGSSTARDWDTYLFTVTSTATVRFCVTAEFPGFIGIGPVHCTNDYIGIEQLGGCEERCAVACLEPGTYFAVIAHDFIENPCDGTAGNDYIAALSCTPECISAPKNDACDFAEPIGDGVTAFTNEFATSDGPTLPPDCSSWILDLYLFNDVWFEYTAARDGELAVELADATIEARLLVYESVPCPELPLHLLGCTKSSCAETTSVSVPITCGSRYLIRVGGTNYYSGGTGTLVLDSIGRRCGPDADLNGDGSVEGADLALLLGSWGDAGDADLNGNGIVDAADLAILLGSWTG